MALDAWLNPRPLAQSPASGVLTTIAEVKVARMSVASA